IVIREQRWCDGTIRRLADADGRARREETREVPCQRSRRWCDARGEHAYGEESGTRARVAQYPENRRGDHVDNDEPAGEESELGVADPQAGVSETLAQGRGDVTVQVVEQVDGRE